MKSSKCYDISFGPCIEQNKLYLILRETKADDVVISNIYQFRAGEKKFYIKYFSSKACYSLRIFSGKKNSVHSDNNFMY